VRGVQVFIARPTSLGIGYVDEPPCCAYRCVSKCGVACHFEGPDEPEKGLTGIEYNTLVTVAGIRERSVRILYAQ
jgi:hypothetical protein